VSADACHREPNVIVIVRICRLAFLHMCSALYFKTSGPKLHFSLDMGTMRANCKLAIHTGHIRPALGLTQIESREVVA